MAQDPLHELHTLALDLRGSSSSQADDLWSQVDPDLWRTTRNPWLIHQVLDPDRREALARDPHFRELLRRYASLRKQSLTQKSWFEEHHGGTINRVLYLSMEFGLSESLPIYSGGLGILAGDHLKASSDLGVPLTGVGLLYGQGYFRQVIDSSGNQRALYPYNDSGQLPILPLLDRDGGLIRIPLRWPGRTLWVRAWRVRVGRVPLYLLDTNDLMNAPADRAITAALYAGDPALRLQQEMVLGIGAIRLMERLGQIPDRLHLNEGHAALAVIERAYQHPLPFQEAFKANKQTTLFTTHTAVPAGFDRFNRDLLEEYLAPYLDQINLPLDPFFSLGEHEGTFNMAYLAGRGSGAINAVSRLHREVTQKLLGHIGAPIGSVTNGVHVPSWESPEADDLWTSSCGAQRWMGSLERVEEEIRLIPDEELWAFRNGARQGLIAYTQEQAPNPLQADRLTVAFARRFATYKRLDLLLTDQERLTRLLTDPDKPIQLILAGKAHPDDEPGREMINRWLTFISRPHIREHVLFIPDYDILLAERLVQGADLWLNMPERPWEASGTSGMKTLVNGGLNLSVLDGWWDEAYSPEVGWAIGEDAAESLYTLLEGEIRETFYDRDQRGFPTAWLAKVRESMATLTPRFSTNRMVREYVENYYLTGIAK
ncbi:MAG: alpha-glucan family phosphorylase [Parachlamydiales bacterium]